MKAFAGCLLVFLLMDLALTDECEMSHFYKELGCSPITDTAENSSTKAGDSVDCPLAFSCDKLHPDSSMCYYRGVGYPDRSPLPESVIRNPCSIACRCSVSNGIPSFSCAVVDCVEVFEGRPSGECVRTYSLNECCSTGKVCGKDAMAQLKSCEFEGKSYKEGERFYPENTHKKCICTGEWTGKLDSEACADIDCGLEIHYQDKLYQLCAPVFLDNSKGCPYTFKCPDEANTLIRGLNVRGVSTQCAFGNQTLSVGDAIDFADCTRCSCNVPPFLDCSKQPASKCQTS